MSSVIKEAESPEHKRLVKSLIAYMEKKGFEITCASYTDFKQCPKINEYIPDVRGKNEEGLIAYGEAKTCDDLDNERTKKQFKAFSKWRMKGGKSNGKDVPLYIAITKDCEKELEKTLKELNLDKKPNVHGVPF